MRRVQRGGECGGQPETGSFGPKETNHWPLFHLDSVATVLWHVPSGLIPVPKMHVDNEPLSLPYGQEAPNR